ncbi:hypothetical protein [Caballeronia sp. GACF4]|uniref:hypothetical protein n=1 Tax=Caballeronia sp. GACF4 TaxID=2921763 RepID=UPI0020295B3D|nr:hypothetical protein [Caballeronia sp. GACF4]
MNQDGRDPLPDDTDEWIRLLQSDDGRAAREHLAAGRAIFYREPDTPAGLCIKKYPDGHREWVSFDRKTGDEVLVRRLDDGESSSLADRLAQPGEKADFDFDPPRAELEEFQSEALFTDESDKALLDERLAKIKASTQAANDALDDALSSIAVSIRRIDKMLGNKPGED